MSRLLLALTLLPLVACGPKKAPEPAAKHDDGGITSDTKLPDDADTRAFADHLIRHPIKNLKPSDGGGAEIMWTNVHFGPKNHFQATSTLAADNEVIDCEEDGDWEMNDKADSREKGIVEVTVTKSTCPGRPGNNKLRLLLTEGDGSNYTVVFR